MQDPDDIPDFLKKGPQSEMSEALKKKIEETNALINERAGVEGSLGGRGSAKSELFQAKFREMFGDGEPDVKAISLIEKVKMAPQPEPDWKKHYAPRPIPAFGWKCGDAYKLYKYQSKSTGLIEWIWNSRDGVTPFGMIGLDGTEAQRVDWHEDLYCPNYVPVVGARIWADRPDFDEKLHQFNLRIVVVDQALHDYFRRQASFTPWVPSKTLHTPTRYA